MSPCGYAGKFRPWSWIALCFFFLVPALSPAWAVERARLPREAERALRASVRSLGLQTELPADAAEKDGTARPGWDFRLPSFRAVESVSKALLYGSIAVIAAVLFATWRGNLWSLSRSRRFARSAGKEVPAVMERMDKAQAEADEFADRGDFAGAMHTLLLRSVEELRRHSGASVPASLTSREILGAVGFPPEGRFLFADIVDRVEISYFGAYRPGADEYAACRRSFDALTGVLARHSASPGGLS